MQAADFGLRLGYSYLNKKSSLKPIVKDILTLDGIDHYAKSTGTK